jgi:hypothetical protein
MAKEVRMKVMSWVAGIILLVAGLACIAWLVGGVLSRAPGATEVSNLAPWLIIHVVTMALGTFLIGKAVVGKRAA